jgi:hypothetical protein
VSRNRVRLLLVVYGAAVCGAGAVHWTHTLLPRAVVMVPRQVHMEASFPVLDAGGPPLLGRSDNPRLAGGTPGAKGPYVPIGTFDDQGMYLFVPLAGKALGTRDVPVLLRRLYILFFAALLLVYPLIFYELLDSWLAALVAPLALGKAIGFALVWDVYWITAWCVALGLPVLWLVHRRWGRYAPVALAGLLTVASFASAMRINSGLPILLGALALVVLHVPGWARRGALACVLVLAYLSVQPLAMSAVRRERDLAIGQPFASEFPGVHPFWHNVYMGLGYVPNREGITYLDDVSHVAGEQAQPGVRYLSGDYEAVMRRLTFRVARHDPGLVARNLVRKTRVILHRAADRFWLVLVALPLMLTASRRRKEFAVYAALAAPAFVVYAVPPLATLPIDLYASGWLGTWAVLFVLACCWIAASVEGAGVAFLRARRVELPRPGRYAVAATVLLAAVAIGLKLDARRQHATDYDAVFYSRSTPLGPAPRAGGTVRSWRFAGGVPRGWKALSPTGAKASATVFQGQDGREYDLISPAVALRPGRYVAFAHGRVLRGGVAMGATGAGVLPRNLPSGFHAGEFGYDHKEMFVPIEVGASTRARIVFRNWTPDFTPALWSLDRVELVRDPRFAPGAGLPSYLGR